MTHVQAFLKDEQGITTVEIILILVDEMGKNTEDFAIKKS